MSLYKTIIISLFLGLCISCTNSSETEESEVSTKVDLENRKTSNDGCRFEDGTHSATVDYSNSETGYNQTYTLDVEVENCEVVQINFPRGGWLDSDNITPGELEEDGSCTIVCEEGKTYEIQIDN